MKTKRLLCLLSLLTGVALHAQSVTVEGDVSPSPADSPVWNAGSDLVIGANASGAVTIANGGTVTVNGGAGSVTIGGDASGTLNFGSADLANPTTAGTLNAEGVAFGFGDGFLNFNQTDNLDFSLSLSGGGHNSTVSQRGSGTTTLSGDNSAHAGDIKVHDGTLVITSTTGTRDITASGTADATFRVTTGGTLSAGSFYVANEGGGNLLIDGGGQASGYAGGIGSGLHTGQATVTGAGSQWTLDADLLVGDGGHGTVTLADGANLTIGTDGALRLALDPDSSGTLNFGAYDLDHATTAGTLITDEITFGWNDGGVAGTGTINFNQTDSLTVAATISGDGTINQRGTGTTTLTAVNTHTGATNILGGTLALRDGGSIANSSTVHVASGGTLDATGSFLTFGPAQTLSGAGTLKGEIVVNGTLSVGDTANSAGLLSFTNSLELTDTSFLLIELGGLERGLSFDAINVVGDIAFDGTLVVSLLDGFTPTDGDLFQIFDFGGHMRGDFANIVFANGGYTASFNAGAGALTISAIPEPSTYAALAGALVLGLTAWRRRAVRLRRLG